ncbi:MAG: HD domain-containing protein [bacterium]|nr:HD domain-containing protein [bacterium]
MLELVLGFDVFNLDNQKIASAGQPLTPQFFHELMHKRTNNSPPITFADYPQYMDDLCDFVLQPPYDRIFDTPEICRSIADRLMHARIFPVVIQTLDYFKQYDFYTYRHSLIVAALATRMAFDIQSYYSYSLQAASVVPGHDIGKYCIPLEILQKQEYLNPQEIRRLREHAVYGCILLTYYLGEHDPTSCQIAYEHHEYINGKGYPRGIKQNNELLQVVTVCDMFDALVSPRPYRSEQYTVRGALELLCEAALTGKINLNCVKLLISYMRADKPPIDKITISKEKRTKEPENNKYSLGAILVSAEGTSPS